MKVIENKKAPGRQVIKRLSLRTKWILLSVVSLLLIGYGLSVFGGAVWMKGSHEPFIRWFLTGFYSLILIGLGLILFSNAIRLRVRMDTRKELRRFLRKNRRFLSAKNNSSKQLLAKKKLEKETPAKNK
ncbi:MAG: hypothetical protein QM669_10635 [Siphonobacter sp.]